MSAASGRNRFAGLAAARWLLNTSAQRTHRSAIRLHVALLAGSRVNLAMRWQSAACLRNSSDGFIRPLLLVVRLSWWRGETLAHNPRGAASRGRAPAMPSSPCRRATPPPIGGTLAPAVDTRPDTDTRAG